MSKKIQAAISALETLKTNYLTDCANRISCRVSSGDLLDDETSTNWLEALDGDEPSPEAAEQFYGHTEPLGTYDEILWEASRIEAFREAISAVRDLEHKLAPL